MQNVNVQKQNQQVAQNQPGPNSKKQSLVKFIAGIVVILVSVGGYFAYQQFVASPQSNQDTQPAVNQNGETGLAQVDSESDTSNTVPAGSKESLPPIEDDPATEIASEAKLAVSSPKSEYSVGDQLTAQVNLSSPTVPEGVEFVLSYDPQILSNVTLEKGEAFSTYLKTNVYQDKGKIKVVIIKNPGEEINLQPQTPLINIKADIKQAGSFSFEFEQGQTIVAATGGKDILQDTESLTVQVQ